MIEKLKNLIKELADKSGFDEKRIWVGENSYGEYEIEIDQEVWGNCYFPEEAENTIRCIFKGISLCNNTVKLPNGKYLMAEANIDSEYKEIIVGIQDENKYYLQDLAVIGAEYHYENDKVVIDDGKYSIKIYSDETKEDWQHEYTVKEYTEE